MRIYLKDEVVEEYKKTNGYLEKYNIIMLMSKQVSDERQNMYGEMFSEFIIDDLDTALSLESANFPLEIHFSSVKKGFDYAKLKPEIEKYLDRLIMYVDLRNGNNIKLMFRTLGPAFSLMSPAILCKEFGNAIAFMLAEDVVDMEFSNEDDDLNNHFAKNLINKSKEEQMQYIYSYCDKVVVKRNEQVS